MSPAAIPDFERDYHESLLIVLDTLEKCLSMQANLHPSSQGHLGSHYAHHVYSGNRIGRGTGYQQLKINRPGAAANHSGVSSTSQTNQQIDLPNSTKDKEGNSPAGAMSGSTASNGTPLGNPSNPTNTPPSQPSVQKYDDIKEKI